MCPYAYNHVNLGIGVMYYFLSTFLFNWLLENCILIIIIIIFSIYEMLLSYFYNLRPVQLIGSMFYCNFVRIFFAIFASFIIYRYLEGDFSYIFSLPFLSCLSLCSPLTLTLAAFSPSPVSLPPCMCTYVQKIEHRKLNNP